MYFKNKITASLCVVLFCLSCCLFPGVYAAEGEDEGAVSDPDVYIITIEFGNLSFYYDYGVWDVNSMRYVADDASINPADGTDEGFPGWYGFDSIANRIAIINESTDERAVTFSLAYRSLTEDELPGAGVTDVGMVSGVTMTVSDGGWSNGQVAVPADGNQVVGYVHLQGQPTVAGGRYDSSTMTPIGMLTLSIESWT